MNAITSRLSSIKYLVPLLILALGGAALIYFSTRNFGVGISTDSVKYIAAARNWIAGNGFFSFDNTPLTNWPPLYPFVIGVSGLLFRVDPLFQTDQINALIFGLTIFCIGIYFRRVLPGKPLLGFFGTTAALFSTPLVMVSLWAWSEPLYNLFLVLSLICMDWYLEKRSILSLLSLATCAALATLTRYMGVTLILWGGLVLALKHDNFRNKVRDTGLFLVTSSLPLALWLLRNYLLTGLPMGQRDPSILSIRQVSLIIWENVISWFFPAGNSWHNTAIMASIIFLVIAVWFARRDLQRIVKEYLSGKWPIILYVVVFVLFILVSTLLSQHDINNRMISPLYIPLLILVVQGLAALITSLKSRFPSRVLPAILVLFFLAWMVYCVNAGGAKEINSLVSEGGGLNTRASRENDVALFIKEQKLDQTCKIYTNFVEAVYFMGDMQSSKTLSRKGYAALVSSSQKTGKPVIWPQEEKACLVWFDERINPGYIPAEELKAIANVEALAELKYGAVYSLAPK